MGTARAQISSSELMSGLSITSSTICRFRGSLSGIVAQKDLASTSANMAVEESYAKHATYIWNLKASAAFSTDVAAEPKKRAAKLEG